jgi:hypothetical protein
MRLSITAFKAFHRNTLVGSAKRCAILNRAVRDAFSSAVIAVLINRFPQAFSNREATA